VATIEEEPNPYQTVTSVKNIDAILRARNYEGFHHEFMVLDGETHLSGVAPALVRGVKSIFASDLAK
jgi:hypothetical protein